MKKTFLITIALTQLTFASDNYYYQNSKKIHLTQVIAPSNDLLKNNLNLDYYHNENNITLGVGDKIIVKIKEGVIIEELLTPFHLSFEKILSKNLYLVKVANKNVAIDIANRLSEHLEVEYAQPDFHKTRIRR
ncbi:MAG: hypothetical protein RBT59_11765 [Arcobacteraceae bacterium]|nr:hypothetical protein [Arcobacteraceae bacterium]